MASVLLAIGLLAMNFPVFLDDYDQWGWQIKCGTGFAADLAQATAAVGNGNYADECETALLMRRLWTVPLVVVSGLVGLAVLVAAAATSERESLASHRETA
ncbi:hypothetical protein [Mycobacterium deserti]|uniref:Transmembrane protein n=1 Tax=Mycobacterium deserti TaxID=2978347 RepID=A0ABT2M8P7_9MYCO|nr:hypothetical protein [Mycobacterium deserti]MCT7658640.1 hypothetical protein [Mycobacterium deserti]